MITSAPAAATSSSSSTSSSPHLKFTRQSILSVSQFTRSDLDALLLTASHMKRIVESDGCTDLARGRILGTVFYEPSTRTSSSFQAAFQRLGGQVLNIADIYNSSSVAKGETLSDTMKCLECYCDLIVMRHPKTGSVKEASEAVKIPIINAGDGIGEHPTQSLLDLYTIQAELGDESKTDRDGGGLIVTMLGDLKNGRTVHSLSKLLTCYYAPNLTLHFISPPSLAAPSDLLDSIRSQGVRVIVGSELSDSLIRSTDILYVTRVQKERFTSVEEYETVANAYQIDRAVVAKMKKKARVLHPLPRVNEITVEVDSDERAAYFRQMRYGLFVRMALLAWVLGKNV